MFASHSNRSPFDHNIDHQDARLTRLGVPKRTRVPCGIVAPLVWRVGNIQRVKCPSGIPLLLASTRASFCVKVSSISPEVCLVVSTALAKVRVVAQIVSLGIVVGIFVFAVSWAVKKIPQGVLANAEDFHSDCPSFILFGPVI